MKTFHLLAALTFGLAATVAHPVLACGDKFLVPTRGIRFALTPSARQQAAVLMDLDPASALPGLFAKLSIQQALQKAGYRVTIATTTGEFQEALRQRTWDVLLIDVSHNSLVASGAPMSGSPAIVAVAVNASKADLLNGKKQYSAVLRSPTHSQALVDAFDAAVSERNSARAKRTKKG
jgi:CheY-like chemotaxis protein